MTEENGKTSKQKKKKRRPRCVNHPKAPAVTRCEVCRKPICRDCAEMYEGPRICSEECWETKAAEEQERAAAEQRALRKKKDRMADRAVTIGLWVVVLAVIGVGGFFFVSRASDHSGEKLWEISGSGYSHNYSALPHSGTICFASSDGAIKAIDVMTGNPVWSVNLPDGEKPSHPLMVDNDHCLIHSENKIFLCSSAKQTPQWKITAPLPAIYAEPVILGDNLYLASSAYAPFYEMSSKLNVISAARRPEDRERQGGQTLEERDESNSNIIAASMASGETKWQTNLEDIRVGGLLADGDRVYATGYRPRRYGYYGVYESRGTSRRDSEQVAEQEPLGATQLWALNAKSGKPEWKLDGTGDFLVPPLMSNEGIVFATKENIYLVSLDGSKKWEFPLVDRRVFSLQPYEDKLFVSTDDGFLACLDLKSGEKQWIVQTGAIMDNIAVSPQMVCVPGAVEVGREPRKVIPTKRWEGSEDLLAKAFKSSGPEYDPVLLGLDPNSGETLWTISKIEGDLVYANGVLYNLRRTSRLLLMDASADPSDIAETVSTLGAYDPTTGEKLWETGIDGAASDLRLADGAALVVSRAERFSISGDTGGPVSLRLIAISLQ